MKLHSRNKNDQTRRRVRARRSAGDPCRQQSQQDVEEPRQRGESDLVVKEYGADALRLYEMFMGPLEATKTLEHGRGQRGARLFGSRVAMIVNDRAEENELNAAFQDIAPNEEQNRVLHRTVNEVTLDIERLSFNTAIAKMMEFTNFFLKVEARTIKWRCCGWFTFSRRSLRTCAKSCGNCWAKSSRWPTSPGRATTRRRSRNRTSIDPGAESSASCGAGSSSRRGDEGDLEAAAKARTKIAEQLAGQDDREDDRGEGEDGEIL